MRFEALPLGRSTTNAPGVSRVKAALTARVALLARWPRLGESDRRSFDADVDDEAGTVDVYFLAKMLLRLPRLALRLPLSLPLPSADLPLELVVCGGRFGKAGGAASCDLEALTSGRTSATVSSGAGFCSGDDDPATGPPLEDACSRPLSELKSGMCFSYGVEKKAR